MNLILLRVFDDFTYTGPPVTVKIGREQIVCMVGRPEAGEPMCLVRFIAGDGRDYIPPVDIRTLGFLDCFGAAPFLSDFDGSLKAFLNIKIGDGNDRGFAVLETHYIPQTEG